MEYSFWCQKWCNRLEMNLLFDVIVTLKQCVGYTILVFMVGDGLNKQIWLADYLKLKLLEYCV